MRTLVNFIRFTLAVSTLCGLSHQVGKAQFTPPASVELEVSGDRPVLGLNDFGYIMVYDNKRQAWFFKQDEVWSFSVDSLKFTRHPSITFEDFDLRGGYDDANDQFLFWSRGVGKVYRWSPGEPSPTRIDSSFHHRTQFDHAWFIHPKTSDIYAFGGYGFWQHRGYTSRYEQTGYGWQVVPLHASTRIPQPRSLSLSTYDPKRDQFHIFGGRTARKEGRDDISVDYVRFSDYWVLDVKKNIWQEYPIYGIDDTYDPNRRINTTPSYHDFGVIDTLNDISWYTMRQKEDPYYVRLLAFDLERRFGALTPIHLGNLGLDTTIYWYYYDTAENRLLIFWSNSIRMSDDLSLRVSALPLPSADSTRAIIDAVRQYGSIEVAMADGGHTIWFWLLPVGVIAVGGVLLFQRRRKRTESMPDPSTYPTIRFCFIGEPMIYANGEPLAHGLNDSERGLLFWLYWKHRNGAPHQVTDDIETALWQDSPNIDYLRKQRNRAIQGLNAQLNKHFAPWKLEREWVQGRTSVSDKRKREYAINLQGLTVSCDLDDASVSEVDPDTLLLTVRDHWAGQVRAEWAAELERAG